MIRRVSRGQVLLKTIQRRPAQCRLYMHSTALRQQQELDSKSTFLHTNESNKADEDQRVEIEQIHEFRPESKQDSKWIEFFEQGLDRVVTKRFYEHYKNQHEQAVLPPAPENMPRDENGNELVYFFDDLCQWLFALESTKRRAFMTWLVKVQDRTNLARKIHFAYVRTKLASANVKVEVPKELKREEIFYNRMVLAADENSELLRKMGANRLRKAYDIPGNPGKLQEMKNFANQSTSEDTENVPAFIEELATLDASQKHRASLNQFSFISHKKNKFPSSWNALALEMTGQELAEEQNALHNMTKTDSETYLKNAISSERGLYAQFPFREQEFHKYNMLLDHVEEGNIANETTEGLPSSGFLGAKDDDDIALEYPEEFYERDGAKLNSYSDGYFGESYDPYEIHTINPQNSLNPDELMQVRKKIPGIFTDSSEVYEEYVLKQSRNTVAKTRGRVESFNAYVLVVSHTGFVGAGFGEARDQNNAIQIARKNAILNIRSIPRSAYPLMRNEIRCKFMKSEVIFYPSTHRNPVARPLFKRILTLLGIEYVAVKCYGSNNILHVIPAFFKCLDQLKTVEKEAMQRGMIPKHLYNRVDDYLEKVRHNRGVYGWH